MHRSTAKVMGALLLAVGFQAASALAADHRDAPSLLFENGGDRALDLNDVYVFSPSAASNNTVLILTVSPLAAPGEVRTFNVGGFYDINIDTNGDAIEDLTFRARFKAPRDGRQRFRVVRIPAGQGHTLIAEGLTGSDVTVQGGGKVRADLFDDPFFFDLAGFQGSVLGSGSRRFNDGQQVDFFRGFNTLALVLEVPRFTLGGQNIRVWSRTTNASGRQIDRTALPAINTVFFTLSATKEAFNAGLPRNDRAVFNAEAVATMQSLGNTPANAQAIVNIVLPDTMPFDTRSQAGFLNGRRLADDVVDTELGLITGGAIPGDGVPANDRVFRTTFPYLAPRQ